MPQITNARQWLLGQTAVVRDAGAIYLDSEHRDSRLIYWEFRVDTMPEQCYSNKNYPTQQYHFGWYEFREGNRVTAQGHLSSINQLLLASQHHAMYLADIANYLRLHIMEYLDDCNSADGAIDLLLSRNNMLGTLFSSTNPRNGSWGVHPDTLAIKLLPGIDATIEYWYQPSWEFATFPGIYLIDESDEPEKDNGDTVAPCKPPSSTPLPPEQITPPDVTKSECGATDFPPQDKPSAVVLTIYYAQCGASQLETGTVNLVLTGEEAQRGQPYSTFQGESLPEPPGGFSECIRSAPHSAFGLKMGGTTIRPWLFPGNYHAQLMVQNTRYID